MAINKEKIKELLDRLNSLEQGSLPEVKSLTNDIIKQQYDEATNRIKESSTVKFLEAINSKLDAFKKDFDLKPVTVAITDFQNELESIKTDSSSEFVSIKAENETNLSQTKLSIKNLENNTSQKTSPLLKSLNSLQQEFSLSAEVTKVKESTLAKLISDIQTSVQNLSDNTEKSKSENGKLVETSIKGSSEKLMVGFDKELKKIRSEFNSRIANIGGGAMNRQINVNSSVMSLKYTDINFKAGSNVTLTKADDNTNKRVDITITATGGGGAGNPSAPDTSVQFNDGGNFGGDADFLWDKTNKVLSLGSTDGTATITGIYNGQDLAIVGANSTSSGLPGGGIDILGGDGTVGSSNGGIVIITGGTKIGTGHKGDIWLNANETIATTSAGGFVVIPRCAGTPTGVPDTIGSIVYDTSNNKFYVYNGSWVAINSGGSGTTRATSIISASTTAGATAGTDYVYFAAAGIKVTLPTAVGNTNLYTVKNTSASSVLIATTSAQTIDGSGSALMPVQNQSLDFISDNVNWNVV